MQDLVSGYTSHSRWIWVQFPVIMLGFYRQYKQSHLHTGSEDGRSALLSDPSKKIYAAAARLKGRG